MGGGLWRDCCYNTAVGDPQIPQPKISQTTFSQNQLYIMNEQITMTEAEKEILDVLSKINKRLAEMDDKLTDIEDSVNVVRREVF